MMFDGPLHDLLYPELRQPEPVSHAAFGSKKLWQRGTAGQAPQSFDQRGVDAVPGLVGRLADGAGLGFRPLSGAGMVGVGPAENGRDAKMWEIAWVADASVFRKQSGQRRTAGQAARPVLQCDVHSGPFLAWRIKHGTAPFRRPIPGACPMSVRPREDYHHPQAGQIHVVAFASILRQEVRQ
jgi:hypothetical protein